MKEDPDDNLERRKKPIDVNGTLQDVVLRLRDQVGCISITYPSFSSN